MNTIRYAISVLFPPTCISCGHPLSPESPLNFCPTCYAKLPWWNTTEVLPPPLPKGLNSFHAPLLYRPPLREAITAFKFSGKTHYADVLAKLITSANLNLLLAPPLHPLVIPVPTHPKRLRKRGYNQTALLARVIAKHYKMPIHFTALKRTEYGEHQASLTRAQRLKLKNSAFAATSAVTGKTVILVDDIFTTGATARACTNALRAAGASAVHLVTLAYTPPTES